MEFGMHCKSIHRMSERSVKFPRVLSPPLIPRAENRKLEQTESAGMKLDNGYTKYLFFLTGKENPNNTIGDKIVETPSSNAVDSENKTSTPLPPLH